MYLNILQSLCRIIGTAELWPYLILLQAIPAVVSLAITPFMPDTPRYLMLRKHDEPAAQKGRRPHACKVEMTMGMGFPMGMGIPWESHGNGNW